jgi:putative ABC transport system permease protein
MSFIHDLGVAFRSLFRTKGLAVTVVLTLALGIGANAAIFTLVRGVLLKPLVNRDENRLIYIRQSAPGSDQADSRFSVPEIQDLRASVKTLSAIGDFSTIGFTMIGLGEPREVQAGVVSGNYFDVMGLHPVLGRLVGSQDDGPTADGVVVLTYRFWTTALRKDPSVIGKTVRLDSGMLGNRSAIIIGVLEPSVPYPQETEIIANVSTSPHHATATMVTDRLHRMTELFGRLAPGVTLEQARAELRSVHGAMTKQHPEFYAPKANYQISAKLLRDQITSGARTILLVLLAASALVFIVACSNVANLILTRTVRREGELAIRAALGASSGALRRMLLAECLLLCGAGATLGVMSAQPLVAILARYASRFSVRALDLTVDSSLLWVGAALAILAAVILAFVPRLPSTNTSKGLNLSSGSVRITGSTSRQRIFAITQIAASFVLLAGASMLITTLIALQSAQTGLDMRHVLSIEVPAMSYGKTPQQVTEFYKDSIRRIDALPGVIKTAFGLFVPWRDDVFGLQFSADGHVHASDEEDPTAQFRVISPGFFAALGVPIVEGRDFNDLDGKSKDDPVAIVSQTLARRMFPNQDAINRHVYWTDARVKFVTGLSVAPHRIIGVTADIDDVHVVPEPTVTIYTPVEEGPIFAGHLFIHTAVNPYLLVTPVTRVIRDMSANQPVEHPATLEDVRAEVLTSDRLNSLVFGVFAAVALAIALVGVAGVLAFSVSARTREFGIRLALGSQPGNLLRGVILEGAIMAAAGVLAGAAFGFLVARLAGSYFLDVQMPGALPVVVSAFLLLAAAVVASSLPALRAARIDVIQALRAD